MTSKKITLKEARSIVKQIIAEEFSTEPRPEVSPDVTTLPQDNNGNRLKIGDKVRALETMMAGRRDFRRVRKGEVYTISGFTPGSHWSRHIKLEGFDDPDHLFDPDKFVKW